jgi:hypothetical protein
MRVLILKRAIKEDLNKLLLFRGNPKEMKILIMDVSRDRKTRYRKPSTHDVRRS